MEMNHHIMAKATTDSILSKYKSGEWSCYDNIGKDFFRVTTDASFPSPDAAFYDDKMKFLVSFEFKPPSETKRGILTGVGQSIAYLQDCSVSFLIAPVELDGFQLENYLKDLYNKQIYGKIPSGLITYENNIPENVRLICGIDTSLSLSKNNSLNTKSITTSRYWAKHQDLPIPLFHLLLHSYYLKTTNSIKEDAFAYFWKTYLISENVLIEQKPKKVHDIRGDVIKTVAQTKDIAFLEKIIGNANKLDPNSRIEKIKNAIDTNFKGDNYYNSIKKNYVTFLKHLKIVDSVGNLTEMGFKLYHLGLTNGPKSKIFSDFFLKEVLTTGHHLELILDLDKIIKENKDKTTTECIRIMKELYEVKGMLKKNPNRQVNENSKVEFLKFEMILWRSVRIVEDNGDYSSINWKLIIEICSLPDL